MRMDIVLTHLSECSNWCTTLVMDTIQLHFPHIIVVIDRATVSEQFSQMILVDLSVCEDPLLIVLVFLPSLFGWVVHNGMEDRVSQCSCRSPGHVNYCSPNGQGKSLIYLLFNKPIKHVFQIRHEYEIQGLDA